MALPIGGACAKRSFDRSVSRSTMRTERRSKRNDIAELDPTPSFTLFQSSPDVLSTMAQPCTSTLPFLPSTTRYVGFHEGASVTYDSLSRCGAPPGSLMFMSMRPVSSEGG